MSQPIREAEIADMESRGYDWDGSEWIKLPKMTARDLDIILSGFERQINHYRVQQIIHPSGGEEYNYAAKMLKKLDKIVVSILARYHNQE